MFDWLEKPYSWQRYDGYEVSSAGDRRFSPLFAVLEDGRTIEDHYHCDVKGYNPSGTGWRKYKGKPSLRHSNRADLWLDYLQLYARWAEMNPLLMDELAVRADEHGRVLTDMFQTSEINQAHALAHLLNKNKGL
jgi:hypothetical protein